jgi:hypothetical protein
VELPPGELPPLLVATSLNKDLRQLIKESESQGWEVPPPRKGGHLKFIPPDGGAPLFHGSTDSDHRALKNHIARMRRHGFVWKGR